MTLTVQHAWLASPTDELRRWRDMLIVLDGPIAGGMVKEANDELARRERESAPKEAA